MDEGRIVERGSHNDLILHQGIYAGLLKLLDDSTKSENIVD